MIQRIPKLYFQDKNNLVYFYGLDFLPENADGYL
jgi:hypothetical protein